MGKVIKMRSDGTDEAAGGNPDARPQASKSKITPDGVELAEVSSRCGACSVRDLAFCAAFAPHELAKLDAMGESVRLTAGQDLFQQDDTAEHVYTVTSGAVRLCKLLADGRRQVTGFMLSGDLFGYAGGDSYYYGAEAVTDCTICRFSRRKIEQLCEVHPRLQQRILQMIQDRLGQMQEQMLLLGRMTPIEKVAAFLLQLADRAGMPQSPLAVIMNRGDIADYLGLTVETVSRSFTRLKQQGLIELPESSRVILKDIEALQALADPA